MRRRGTPLHREGGRASAGSRWHARVGEAGGTAASWKLAVQDGTERAWELVGPGDPTDDGLGEMRGSSSSGELLYGRGRGRGVGATVQDGKRCAFRRRHAGQDGERNQAGAWCYHGDGGRQADEGIRAPTETATADGVALGR